MWKGEMKLPNPGESLKRAGGECVLEACRFYDLTVVNVFICI